MSAILPGNHRIDAQIESGARLPSNSIIDIIPHDSSLWLGSGKGLVELHLTGGWSVIDQADGIGQGGISAIAITDDTIWAATAYSEDTEYGWKPAGGGVGFSINEGETWTWMSQPVDSPDETEYDPTTTNIQNLIYDIALSDSAVWIASFGGGLRKLPYGSDEWVINPPDDEPFGAFRHYNHRAFSVVFHDGVLIAGTAEGVNVSLDEGINWMNIQHIPRVTSSISGNFVTALGVQETEDNNYIWAATWRAERASEYYGVCVSGDNGINWRVALSDSTALDSTVLLNGEYLVEYLVEKYGPMKAHNFGFRGDTVYVAADRGLWISFDRGLNWGDSPLQSIYDPTIGELLEYVNFYSVTPVGDTLWIGTDDGLAKGWFDAGKEEYTWRIHRAHQPAGVGGEPSTYAYPNPFSPERGHITRIQLPVNGQMNVNLSIYNFAMEKVYETLKLLPGDGAGDMIGYGTIIWDGLDSQRRIVANGVYFYRVKTGGSSWWGKIMVMD
ncbi:hypothetical protein HQ587_08160 [bacterium]|nr:hypothetical protein [bacterium]